MADLRATVATIGPGGPCVLHVQRGASLLFVVLLLD